MQICKNLAKGGGINLILGMTESGVSQPETRLHLLLVSEFIPHVLECPAWVAEVTGMGTSAAATSSLFL